MGIRVGEDVLVMSAAEYREGPDGKSVEPWDIAGIAVRTQHVRVKGVHVYMMNAEDTRAVIALLQKALDEAPPEEST